MDNNTCCFIGHRKIIETEKLNKKLFKIIKNLILENKVNTFLFGSKSRFNDLCLEIVTELKQKHPNIKRVYVRAEFPYISEHYENYLSKSFEETYYPEKIKNSGKAVYVERNFEMIDKSRFCVFYYNEQTAPKNRKSGTKIALDYAISKEKQIIKL